MGGFHLIDFLIVALIGLAIFGPKALQSMARNAGKGVGQVQQMKETILSDLSLDEVRKIAEDIPQLPTNSLQAMQMLIETDVEEKSSEVKTKDEKKVEAKPSEMSTENKKKVEAKQHDETH